MTEIVLTYIDQQSLKALLDWESRVFDYLVLLDTSQMVGDKDDAYGQGLVQTYIESGAPMIGSGFLASLAIIRQNYESRGLTAEVVTWKDMYYRYLDQQDRARIEAIEPSQDEGADNFMRLTQEHYSVSLAKTKRRTLPGLNSDSDLKFKVIDRLTFESIGE